MKYLDHERVKRCEDKKLINKIMDERHKIAITFWENLSLFFSMFFGTFIPHWVKKVCKCKFHKFRAIYKKGEQMLDKNLDVLNLIQEIAYLKLIVKYYIRPDYDTKL